jgi:hypothetical protein
MDELARKRDQVRTYSNDLILASTSVSLGFQYFVINGVGAAHVASIVARPDSLIARYGDAAGAVRGSDELAPVMPAGNFDVDRASAVAQLDGAVAQLFHRLMSRFGDFLRRRDDGRIDLHSRT